MTKETSTNYSDDVSDVTAIHSANVNQEKLWHAVKFKNISSHIFHCNFRSRVLFFRKGYFYHDTCSHKGQINS